jgi:tyrosine-protein phosphatase YwqE
MITEARKFGIATTIAHQERYGQLSEDKKIQGATAVVANKIVFQVTVTDSQGLAYDFAKPPSTSN